MTGEEHDDHVDRIRAERIAQGRKPYIESPSVYLLLDAILACSAKEKSPE